MGGGNDFSRKKFGLFHGAGGFLHGTAAVLGAEDAGRLALCAPQWNTTTECEAGRYRLGFQWEEWLFAAVGIFFFLGKSDGRKTRGAPAIFFLGRAARRCLIPDIKPIGFVGS